MPGPEAAAATPLLPATGNLVPDAAPAIAPLPDMTPGVQAAAEGLVAEAEQATRAAATGEAALDGAGTQHPGLLDSLRYRAGEGVAMAHDIVTSPDVRAGVTAYARTVGNMALVAADMVPGLGAAAAPLAAGLRILPGGGLHPDVTPGAMLKLAPVIAAAETFSGGVAPGTLAPSLIQAKHDAGRVAGGVKAAWQIAQQHRDNLRTAQNN